jgi:glutamyl/glutaminyl-tRNA synthetase
MPSVKSYQNRKADIARLNEKLAEAEYQLRKIQQEFRVALSYKNADIDKLQNINQHYVNMVLDQMRILPLTPVIVNTGKQEIELLKKEIDRLKLTLRLYREYILKTYHDADFIDLVEIPNCLKPLDSIKYVGELNGLDR